MTDVNEAKDRVREHIETLRTKAEEAKWNRHTLSLSRRWNVEERDGGALAICHGYHDKCEDCEWVEYVPRDTAEGEASTLRTENETLRAQWEEMAELVCEFAAGQAHDAVELVGKDRDQCLKRALTAEAERDAAIARAEEAERLKQTNRKLHRRMQIVEGPMASRMERGEREAAFWLEARKEAGRRASHALFRANRAETEALRLTAKLAQAEGEIATMRAALEQIAQASPEPDDKDWYPGVYGQPASYRVAGMTGEAHEVHPDEEQPGDMDSFGFERGVHSLAVIARTALTNPEPPHGD